MKPWTAPLVLQSGKRDFVIDPPIMNMSGMLDPAGVMSAPPQVRLGAVVTPSISLRPRSPARPPRVLRFKDGLMLHTGHPNPGLRASLKSYGSKWGSSSTPVVLHLIGDSPEDIETMVQRVENQEAIAAIEIGLLRMAPSLAADFAAAATTGELPTLIQLPLDAEVAQVQAVAATAPDAISMGPPRGLLPFNTPETIEGRLYGPFLLPLALRAVQRWTELIEIPIIGGCGLYRPSDVVAMFNTGASAVQLDTVLWTNPESFSSELT